AARAGDRRGIRAPSAPPPPGPPPESANSAAPREPLSPRGRHSGQRPGRDARLLECSRLPSAPANGKNGISAGVPLIFGHLASRTSDLGLGTRRARRYTAARWSSPSPVWAAAWSVGSTAGST